MKIFKIDDFSILFMIWNYALAIVPFLIFGLIKKIRKSNPDGGYMANFSMTLLSIVWLLFLPNTIYIILDVRHLAGVLPSYGMHTEYLNLWAVIVLFSYAVVGWIFFILAVRQAGAYLKSNYTDLVYRIFITAVIPICALGVLLGLIQRYNSWSVFTRPYEVIISALNYFHDWMLFKNWLIFTLFLYLLYFLGEKTISIQKRKI